MPIDSSLINQATEYSVNRLHSQPADSVMLFDSFILPELTTKLIEFLDSNAIPWESETDQTGAYAMDNRLRINWLADTVIEEAHTVFENLTEVLNTKFNRTNTFLGISIWRDTQNYTINRHSDNPIIDIAMQIYLTGGPASLGTWFDHNSTTVQATYKVNSGYLLDNSERVEHWLDATVPNNHVRYSLYARWKLSND